MARKSPRIQAARERLLEFAAELDAPIDDQYLEKITGQTGPFSYDVRHAMELGVRRSRAEMISKSIRVLVEHLL